MKTSKKIARLMRESVAKSIAEGWTPPDPCCPHCEATAPHPDFAPYCSHACKYTGQELARMDAQAENWQTLPPEPNE